MKSIFWFLIKVGISGCLIIFLFQRVDTIQVIDNILKIGYGRFALAILVYLVTQVIYTYKWQMVLKDLRFPFPFRRLLILNLISVFYNTFLPSQASGELVKGIRLARTTNQGITVLSSIVIDRLTNLFVGILIASIAVIFAPFLSNNRFFILIIAGLICSFSIFGLFVSRKTLGGLTGKINLLPLNGGWPKRLKGYLSYIYNSFRGYGERPFALLRLLFFSLIIQLLVTGMIFIISQGLNINVSFMNLIWVTMLVSIFQLLPVSIAGIGVREGGFVFLLGQLGIPSSSSLTLSLIIFGINILMGLVGGAIDLFHPLVAGKQR